MKNLNYIINGILAIAVIILFVLYFKKSDSGAAKQIIAKDGSTKVIAANIAYIDIDTLESKMDYFQQRKKELEARQKNLESTFARDEQNFQREYADAMQKAQTATSQEELAALEQKIQKKGMDIQQRKENMANSFMLDQEKFSEEINLKLDTFIQEYNKDEKYAYIFSYKKIGLILYKPKAMDITEEVIKGMNEKYPIKK